MGVRRKARSALDAGVNVDCLTLPAAVSGGCPIPCSSKPHRRLPCAEPRRELVVLHIFRGWLQVVQLYL